MGFEQPLVDKDVLGRLLRASRIAAGHDSVKETAAGVRELGVPMSDRTLYAIERGEQMPTVDQFTALLMVTAPPSGAAFFARAFRADALPMFEGNR